LEIAAEAPAPKISEKLKVLPPASVRVNQRTGKKAFSLCLYAFVWREYLIVSQLLRLRIVLGPEHGDISVNSAPSVSLVHHRHAYDGMFAPRADRDAIDRVKVADGIGAQQDRSALRLLPIMRPSRSPPNSRNTQKGSCPEPERKGATPALHIGCQVRSTRTGISFLTGTVRNDGGSILKSESFAGIAPVIRVSLP